MSGTNKTTKFSDLNAYHQFIQTRAAATLTTASLAIAVSGVVAGLLPDPAPLRRAYFLLILIGCALIGTAVYSFRALLTEHKFQRLLTKRLAAVDLPEGIDYVDSELQSAYIIEFSRKYRDLRLAAVFLQWAFSLGIIYTLFTLRGPLFGKDPAEILLGTTLVTSHNLGGAFAGVELVFAVGVGLTISRTISYFFDGFLGPPDPKLEHHFIRVFFSLVGFAIPILILLGFIIYVLPFVNNIIWGQNQR